jgi:CubicO group peptidase (beta-lactamase class C family)
MRRFLILFLIALPALAQQQFDKLATDTMAAWHIPGLAVAVVQNDRVVYLKAFGIKQIGKTDPVTPDSLFQIGSTSKAFTTTAMAMLVDEKKLEWDDPVRKHLDYFHLSDPCAEGMVTLRDIVTHRTGLGRHDELWDNSPWSREEVIRRAGEMKLSKPIRSAFQYNNIMFIAAGEVVAAAARMPWDDFVRARIFEPLGMTHTRTRFADWAPSDHATGHRWFNQTVQIQEAADDTNVAPAGSIKSSARDMAQWLRFQLAGGTIDGKRLVSEEALNETRTPQIALSVDKSTHENNPFTNVQSYAMGWAVQDYRGELMVLHSGALNGFRAQVAMLPYRNIGIVILANIGRGLAGAALRNALFDELLHAAPARDWNAVYLAVDKKSDDQTSARKREHEAKRHAENKPTHDLAAYVGAYHNAGYGDATIALENGQLVLRWSRLSIPLVHFNYDTFDAVSEADDVDESLQFALGPDGAVKSMMLFGEEFVKKQP